MKKIKYLMMFTLALTIFNGCQKKETALIGEQPQAVVSNPMFVGLNDIAFSVEDNRLVFESEEEFQKCIDFLANLGDENFPLFEKEIEFDSYRKVNKGTSNWSAKIEDDLFATLINPEGFIQVENYLFKVDFSKEKTYAYVLDESEMELKSASITSEGNAIEFGWDEDGFAVLKGEPQLKRANYCTVNRERRKEWSLHGGENLPGTPYFSVDITAKLVYQHFTFYHSLITKIKSDDFTTNCGTRFKIKMKSIGDIKWDLKRQSPHSHSIDMETEIGSSGPGLDYRPFASRRRVESYYAKVYYEWELVWGPAWPWTVGNSDNITHFLECPY